MTYLDWLYAIACTLGTVPLVLVTIVALLGTIVFAMFVHDEFF